MKVTRAKREIAFSRENVYFDMLSALGILGCRATNTPMKANVKLLPDRRETLDDSGKYHRLVGKLNYLIVTKSDIAFVISVVSRLLSTPRITHWYAVV